MMMMKRLLALLTSFTTVSMAASLTRVTNFGSNPTAMNMYLYRPDNAPTNAPVVVACHPCGGNAQSYFTQTNLKPYADQYGFILVYPEAPHDSNCFETSTTRTQTHNGGGDSYTIVQMVNYTLSTYSADRSRVYALGQSSGGMITNILMGSYPDVFAAGSPNSAFPFACLTGGGSSSPGGNLTCAQGGVIHTGQEWAQLVYNAYPGYTGRRPTVQLWHGTADSLVKIQCLTEEIKQWSTVLNVTFTRNVTNSPSSGYTEMIYGDGSKLRAYIQQGGAHFTPLNEKTVLTNWGLLGGGPSTGSSSTSVSTSTTSSTSSSTTGGCTVAKYGQCGGLNYSGCKTCAAGSTCVYSNDWYSQCL